MSKRIDQTFRKSTAFDFSTDQFARHERLDAMYSLLGRRMNAIIAGDDGHWSVEVRGIASSRGEFLDYSAKGLMLDRPSSMCDDGSSHISLGMVVGKRTVVTQNGRELDLTTGDLYLIDFSRPIQNLNPAHHQMAIALPRAQVASVLGARTEDLGGLKIDGKTGVGAMLAAHMQALGRHISTLDQRGRSISLDTMASLALATMQAHLALPADPETSDHLHGTATLMIRNGCVDPDFNAGRLATLLNCSRSTLYRVFARQGESVSSSIWSARLEHAWSMLMGETYLHLTIADIAFRCGFLEPATFSRLFRRRYGLTPSAAREESRRLQR